MTAKQKYEHVKLSRLKPWKDNPRFNAEAVPQLSKLILEHGFAGVIIASPDGIIRAGHTRYAAMKHLCSVYKKMKTIGSKNWTEGEKKTFKQLRRINPFRIWVEWKSFPSEKAAQDFALADNKASEWATWDHAKLAKLFKTRAKKELAILRRQTGFKQQEIEWQGAAELNKDELNGFEEEEAMYTVQIREIKAADVDSVFKLVKRAVKSTGYQAKIM